MLPALEHPDAETVSHSSLDRATHLTHASLTQEDRESIDSSLSHHSPSYYIAHPPHLCGTLQLMTKALMLTGQVSDFIQRECESNLRSLQLTLYTV